MPESYIEPLTDRQVCFKCQKTAPGKKKLLKCAGCHAITYCCKECQVADFKRHKWNCLPVMVTEIPGKGRGLVAARDIKMGELIFKDKPVIKVPDHFLRPKAYTGGKPHLGATGSQQLINSLKAQIENLPSEAKSQFYKLSAPALQPSLRILRGVNESDYDIFRLFIRNSLINKDNGYGCFSSLYLNISLVNHSCAPNAFVGEVKIEKPEDDTCYELRAIKDIAKGEEINNFILSQTCVKDYGSSRQKRKTAIKTIKGFDCVCPVCLGQVPGQEEIIEKWIELHNQLDPYHAQMPADWRREADIRNKIVDLVMNLYIGQFSGEKVGVLAALVGAAHLARDQDLVRKAMTLWKQLVEDTKLDGCQITYDATEQGLAQWSAFYERKGINPNTPPDSAEIDFMHAMTITLHDRAFRNP